ncbi:MAG: hypothetical protein K2X56_07635 [Mycobacterium pseudokansasii]|uniref:hypothetical protein n=1 Tax=Mycobacterium pseudokansasii TaxID=2341080 RepID=UPI0023F52FB6|nr:hypothetical protein [Mycobacterium pseudokansasii]MBY0387962.1 hypothetical protein [Mycobacterium pseudokansasii]
MRPLRSGASGAQPHDDAAGAAVEEWGKWGTAHDDAADAAGAAVEEWGKWGTAHDDAAGAAGAAVEEWGQLNSARYQVVSWEQSV